MERKIIFSKLPICQTCKKPMKSWNPFANVHEHVECISDRVSEKLIKIIKNQLFKQ